MYKVLPLAALQLFSTLLFSQIDPAKVTIARDEFGVPHIFAETDAEVAYGLAWASCEDLFPTMEETLYTAKGFAGRYKGKKEAPRDYLLHLLGIRELVEQKYETDFSDHFKAYLEAYAQGVNDYVKAHPKEPEIRKAFPITAQDVVAGYVFSLSVIAGVHKQIERAIGGKYDGENVPMGSNAFAMNSRITADGETYLCVNPHMPFDGPFSFYEAHLNSEEGLNVLGGLFPGSVSVSLGSNENLGWSHTWNGLDLVDTYRLKMHPKKKYTYEFDGEWLELEYRPVWLKVKLGGIAIPVKQKAWWSVYGPTVQSKDDKKFYSFRSGAYMDIRVPEQWFRMCKAKNFSEFKAALDMRSMARFNTVYADKNDTIYYVDDGMIPKRDPSYDWEGVVAGNTSLTLWNEFYHTDELPFLLNPECGYVFNTNNAPFNATCDGDDQLTESNYHRNMGFRTKDNNRSFRFREMADSRGSFNFEEFKAIKWDQVIPKDHIFMKSMQNVFDLDPKEYPQIKDAIAVLNRWDHNMDKSSMQSGFLYSTVQKVMNWVGKRGEAVESGLHASDEMWVKALEQTQAEYMEHFGTLEKPFGEIQTFERSGKKVGVGGISDVLAAIASREDSNTSLMNALGGDTYVQLTRFTQDGPIIESLMAGGNSDRTESPHYNDQMDMLTNKQLKPMTLNKDQVLRSAVRIYHPGQ